MIMKSSTCLLLFITLVAVSCMLDESSAFSTSPMFGIRRTGLCVTTSSRRSFTSLLSQSSTPNNNEAVFKPSTPQNNNEDDDNEDDDDDDEDEDVLDKVEQLGRGASKTKRGKRKSGGKSSSKNAAAKAAALAASTPEEVFYEGPPAISETYLPTASILTVVGIIPAAAAWARQAWVRYKITTRRIRVTSGINGQDMAEIVYPDIVELRTAKRFFGDGDMVAFLRDGARFEMRNIPNFDAFIEFVLTHVDPSVAKAYRTKGGDVTNPPSPTSDKK